MIAKIPIAITSYILIGDPSFFLSRPDGPFSYPFNLRITKFLCVGDGKDPFFEFDIAIKAEIRFIRRIPSHLAGFEYVITSKA